MATIDISGIDKAELIAELFNQAKPNGMGWLQNISQEQRTLKINRDSVIATLGENIGDVWLDSPNGRMMDISIISNELVHHVYDRHNGEGLAARIVGNLKTLAKTPYTSLPDGPKAP